MLRLIDSHLQDRLYIMPMVRLTHESFEVRRSGHRYPLVDGDVSCISNRRAQHYGSDIVELGDKLQIAYPIT